MSKRTPSSDDILVVSAYLHGCCLNCSLTDVFLRRICTVPTPMHHNIFRCTNEDIESIVTKNLVDPDKSAESKVSAAALPGGDDMGHTEKKKAPKVRFAAPLHTPEARASKLEQLQQQQLEYLQRQQLESEESEKKISASSCQNNDDQEDECLGILYQMINEDKGKENGDGIIITLNEETLFQCSAMGDNGETLEGMDGL